MILAYFLDGPWWHCVIKVGFAACLWFFFCAVAGFVTGGGLRRRRRAEDGKQ